MRFIRYSAFLLIMIGVLVPSSGSLHACPLCKDAIASPGADGEEEINNAPAAYNNSIYLMVGVPYILLGSVGFLIYRGCQKNAAFQQVRLRDENRDDKIEGNEPVV
jgi:hypothetical protein